MCDYDEDDWDDDDPWDNEDTVCEDCGEWFEDCVCPDPYVEDDDDWDDDFDDAEDGEGEGFCGSCGGEGAACVDCEYKS